MEAVLYFLGIAILMASVFLVLDTQQNRRLNKLTKETKNVPPLFLQRSAELKLNTLNSFLYDNVPQTGMVPAPAKRGLTDRTRQELSAQLSIVIHERNSGKLSLQDYNGKLSELLSLTRSIK